MAYEKQESRFTMKDNRPKWVIKADIIIWIITIMFALYFVYQYGFNYSKVNVYLDCPDEIKNIGGGKIRGLNETAFISENGLEMINRTEKEINLRGIGEWNQKRS